jgi:hypothetical protein
MSNQETVTASEIGDYVYCPEAWRLAQLGHESANHSVQRAGTSHHARKAAAERFGNDRVRGAHPGAK